MTANSGGAGSAQIPFLFAGGIQDRATGWVHDDPLNFSRMFSATYGVPPSRFATGRIRP